MLTRLKKQPMKNLKLTVDLNKRLSNLLRNLIYFDLHLLDLIENVVKLSFMDSILLQRMTTC